MTDKEKEELEYRKPKPVRIVPACGVHLRGLMFYRCPMCDERVEPGNLYCSICGQMLDWNEE